MATSLKDAGTYTNLVKWNKVSIGGPLTVGDKAVLFAETNNFVGIADITAAQLPLLVARTADTVSIHNKKRAMGFCAWYALYIFILAATTLPQCVRLQVASRYFLGRRLLHVWPCILWRTCNVHTSLYCGYLRPLVRLVH